ncbi:hypothetical protein JCGZ_06016 [Jatropha curcas]|uniref:Uncharacterized protein n=1 Tax=Jatropha curcas TaxID=180498 RepID=A0A067L182_JATCU|nr:hypothetical protein JCGZ_06016 [Jatropha curcas]
MIHMKNVEKFGDSYRVIGAPAANSDDNAPAAANIEEDKPPPFSGFDFGVGTSGAGPLFQGTSTVSNDEVLARLLSRMDVFDTRLTGMESTITDMHGNLNSGLDTLQVHYQGLSTQLQTVIQLL